MRAVPPYVAGPQPRLTPGTTTRPVRPRWPSEPKTVPLLHLSMRAQVEGIHADEGLVPDAPRPSAGPPAVFCVGR